MFLNTLDISNTVIVTTVKSNNQYFEGIDKSCKVWGRWTDRVLDSKVNEQNKILLNFIRRDILNTVDKNKL